MDSLNSLLEEVSTRINTTREQLEREKLFAKEAEIRFKKNLTAFEKYYPNIFKAIQEFKTDKPLPIFVTSSGHGDIVDEETGLGIYGDDPIATTKRQVDEHLNKPPVNHIDFSGYAEISGLDDRLHMRSIKKLGEVVVKSGKSQKLNHLTDTFPTGVIFGVGLGYHIKELTERVSFNYLFIIEPSFQNFFLSLYCMNWVEVIDKVDSEGGNLFFHIGVTYEDFIDDLLNISKSVGAMCLTKCFCYRHLPTQKNTDLIKMLFKRIYEIHGGYGFYNDSTTSIAHTIKNLERGVSLLKNKPTLPSRYLSKPVYIVGNGPSLDESIDFIRQTRSNAIIVAAGTALQTLIGYGIEPDFHVLIERPRATYDVLLKTLPKETYKSISLLTMSLIYPDTLDLYEWTGIACKGVDAGGELLALATLVEKNKSVAYPKYSNPTVSNTALSFMITMGFKQLYLFGIDNGYFENGKHHASNSVYDKGALKDFIPQEAKIKLPGNLGGNVWATNLLAISCFQMSRLLKHEIANQVECYNVGEGAFIDGALPLKNEHVLPEFGSIDKSKVIDSIKSSQFFECQIQDFSKYINLGKFEEICEHLIGLALIQPRTRKEALETLQKQSRYLYSLRGTVLSPLFYVLEGELLYFHCPLITLLFSSNDEKEGIKHYGRANQVWLEFLREARDNFKSDWMKNCEVSLELSKRINAK